MSCYLFNDTVALDACSLTHALTLDEQLRVRHVIITHSHLDHVTAIPLLADTLFERLVANPINVYAQQQTVDALRRYIFNGQIWPDFTVLPNETDAVLRLNTMAAGDVAEIDGRVIDMITVKHAVPGAAYRVESNGRSFAFSGDTTSNDSLWSALNNHDSLDLLFIEAAYANRDIELARLASHYCPALLAMDLHKLKHHPVLCVSHLKPGEEDVIMEECRQALPGWEVKQLNSGDVFEI